MVVDVTVKVRNAIKRINNLEGDIPYVNALAINSTAEDAQEAIREHIAREFIVRRRTFINRSIKIEKWANKRSQFARIAVVPPGAGRAEDDVLSQHEWGDDKQAFQGTLAIPTSDAQPDRTKVIRTSKRPRQLKNAFKIRDSTSGKSFLAQRTRKGITFPYILQRSVPLRPRLKFVKTAQDTVEKVWVKNFDEKWVKVIHRKYL